VVKEPIPIMLVFLSVFYHKMILFWRCLLSEIEYGYILKNEDGDIPPELRNILLSAKKEFAKLNFDVSKIRALINI
jgi:hypothetical protein